MSFNNYRADSFIDLLNKKVDDLNYKIILASQQIDSILELLKDGEIPIPSGSGSSSSVPDYSAEIAVLLQLMGNIHVPNSSTTTVTLSEFISYVLIAYVRTINWQLHLAHLPVLPLEGYEILYFAISYCCSKESSCYFFNHYSIQQMYEDINTLMSGDG
jgi:hypothetical protein